MKGLEVIGKKFPQTSRMYIRMLRAAQRAEGSLIARRSEWLGRQKAQRENNEQRRDVILRIAVIDTLSDSR
jgi:hypothetical protein